MRNTRQRIVITGGKGFIGSFLIERLLALGYEEVVSLDRSFERIEKPKINYVPCDVGRHTQIMFEQIRKGDIVIHLACSTFPSISEIDRIKGAQENIIGSINLLEVCRKKGVEKFIFPSSGGTIYGDTYVRPFVESDPTNPKNSYAAMKVAVESFIGVYEHLHRLPSVIMRISNPYGRRFLTTHQLGAIDVFFHQARTEQAITIWGDGEQVRDYIYISDVIDFLILAIEKKSVSGVYNIGTGIGTNLKQVVQLIGETLGGKIPVSYKEQRNIDVPYSVLNIEKARGVGWAPKFELSCGIKKLLG